MAGPLRAAPESLPKTLRVRRRRDFLRIQRQGVRGSSEHLQIARRLTPGRPGRFGLTVSKKVGKAVARNALKRKLRELLRKQRELFVGTELVVIARPGAAELSFAELSRELQAAVAQAAAQPPRKKSSGSRGRRRTERRS